MRYQVPGVPQRMARCGGSAFLPNLTRHAASGAQSYKYAVDGQPGTRGIPAPTHATQMSPDEGDKAQMGYARSSDAPQMWWPSKYYEAFAAEWPGAGMPVRIYDPVYPGPTTLLPTPAVDYRSLYLAQQAMIPELPKRDRRGRQVRSVPRLPRWRGHRGDD